MLINIPKDLGKIEVIPAGIYKATCLGSKVKTSAAGNPTINLEYTITSQGPDDSVKTIGRKIFDTLTISETALGVVDSKLKALTGKSILDIVEAGEVEIEGLIARIQDLVVNKQALLEVKVEPVKRDGAVVEGEFRNSIGKIQKVEG